MKLTRRCPKCQHDRILFIPDVLDQGGGDAYLTYVSDGSFLGMSTVRRVGKQVAYVCRRCGYTERYTLDADSIPVDGTRVQELGAAPRTDPYR